MAIPLPDADRIQGLHLLPHPNPEEAKAKRNVTKDFKDPSSVQWRDLFVSLDGTLKILCGELNGKNSYGAYIGFRRFFATDSILSYVEDPKSPSIMDKMWPQSCGNKVADVVQ